MYVLVQHRHLIRELLNMSHHHLQRQRRHLLHVRPWIPEKIHFELAHELCQLALRILPQLNFDHLLEAQRAQLAIRVEQTTPLRALVPARMSSRDYLSYMYIAHTHTHTI